MIWKKSPAKAAARLFPKHSKGMSGQCQKNFLAGWICVDSRHRMTKLSPIRSHKISPEIIRLEEMLYVRFPLSLWNAKGVLHERGINISRETFRFLWKGFGPMFAAEIRRNRVGWVRMHSNWRWHCDEVVVKINGKTQNLCRAVDHETKCWKTL